MKHIINLSSQKFYVVVYEALQDNSDLLACMPCKTKRQADEFAEGVVSHGTYEASPAVDVTDCIILIKDDGAFYPYTRENLVGFYEDDMLQYGENFVQDNADIWNKIQDIKVAETIPDLRKALSALCKEDDYGYFTGILLQYDDFALHFKNCDNHNSYMSVLQPNYIRE